MLMKRPTKSGLWFVRRASVYFMAGAVGITAAELNGGPGFSPSSGTWQAGMAAAFLGAIIVAMIPERLFASGVAAPTGQEPKIIHRLELLAAFLAGASVVLLLIESDWFLATGFGFVFSLLLSRHLRNQSVLRD